MKRGLMHQFKKVFSLTLVMLLVASSLSGIVSAVDSGLGVSVSAINTKAGTASVSFSGESPTASKVVTISPNGSGEAFNSGSNTLTGLQAGTEYTVTAVETVMVSEAQDFWVHSELVRIGWGNWDTRYYYNDENNNKVYILASQRSWWGIIAYYHRPAVTTTNTATTTFTTENLYSVMLQVNPGGIAFINSVEYPASGTAYNLGSYYSGEVINYVSYSNAGYTGGQIGQYTVTSDASPQTMTINFSSASDVKGLPSYVTDGFFSGYQSNGTDITTSHDPKNDSLSANLGAALNPFYSLGDTAQIKLTFTNVDGDANSTSNSLNEVDIYFEDVEVEHGLSGISNGSEVSVGYFVPSTEDDLIIDGYSIELSTLREGFKTYSKDLYFTAVDRYNSTGGAAMIASAMATIYVDIPVVPEPPTSFTVSFDTLDGTPVPLSQSVVDGETATKPTEDPELTGFTFEFWTLNGETAFDFDTAITSAITLTAYYSENPVNSTEDNSEDSSENTSTTGSEESTQPTTQPPTEPVGPQGSVTVNYVDTEGVTLGSSFTFTGTVGTQYQTSSRTFDGFVLVETPANAAGSFIDGSVTVDYVYSNGEILVEEETPLGESAAPVNFDSIYDNAEVTTEAEEIIIEEETPLADALPQTGQASPELFYGIGSLITAAGVFMKKKAK